MTALKSFGIAAALLAVSGGTAAAQHGTAAVQSTTATPMPACSMMNRGEDATNTTAHRQQMMAQMQAGDKKLDEVVALMNTSRGQDRLDRIADVVKQLVDSRRQMADGMMMMMSESMPMSGMMSGCSMMTPAIGKEEKDGAADDHSAHHPVQK